MGREINPWSRAECERARNELITGRRNPECRKLRSSALKIARRYFNDARDLAVYWISGAVESGTLKGAELEHLLWTCEPLCPATKLGKEANLSVEYIRQVRRRHKDADCPLCKRRYVRDPAEPHRVYLFYFRNLGVYKVGITRSLSSSRIEMHERHGGELLSIVEAVDYGEARSLERRVLEMMKPWKMTLGREAFPHGGGTECWSSLCPIVDLAEQLSMYRMKTDELK